MLAQKSYTSNEHTSYVMNCGVYHCDTNDHMTKHTPFGLWLVLVLVAVVDDYYQLYGDVGVF